MAAPLPDLILYTRAGCHLCEESKALVLDLLADRTARGLATPRLVERDIDADPGLQRVFFDTIPVVEFGDRRLELALSAAKLRRLLADQLDGVAT